VVLLTAPCFSQPESGVEGFPERADATRVADLNSLFRSYAKAHSSRVSVVDLHAYLCPRDRYTPTMHGKTVRDPDGTHLTPDGAKAAWRFLAGQLKQARLLPVQ
jgi:lysophospholipase L1-like esterase